MLEAFTEIDKAVFLFLNRDLAFPAFDFIFKSITNPAFWILPGIVTAAFVFPKMEKKQIALIVIVSIITVVLTDQIAASLIKPLVGRLRPCNPGALVEQGRFLLGYKTSFSFPSNHAMNMFGQAMLFSLLYPRYGVWFFLFAALIGYSRIYVGVHYPLDVLGGAVFGVICGAAVYGGYRVTVVAAAGYYRKRAGGKVRAETR